MGWKRIWPFVRKGLPDITPALVAGLILFVATVAIFLAIYFFTSLHLSARLLVVWGLLLGAAIGVGTLALLRWIRSLRIIRQIETALLSLAGKDFPAIQPNGNKASSGNPRIPRELLQHLEERQAEQLEFLSVVTHELRSPLAAIHGYADLLSDPVLQKKRGYLEKCSAIILDQCKRMTLFVDDVMAAASLDANSNPLTVGPVRLGKLLDCIVEESRQQTGREILYENRLGEAVVMADALRLRQVIWNLVDNATKYSPESEPVMVALDGDASLGVVNISVEDRGIGIQPCDQELLFRRFGRIKNKGTFRVPGSGLGLYIVRTIVELHRGSVAVKSREGEGSIFTVTLPTDPVGVQVEL